MKDLQCLDTVTAWHLFYVYIWNDYASIKEKFVEILGDIHRKMASTQLLTAEEKVQPVPEIAISAKVPRLINHDVSQYNKLDDREQSARRALTIEVDQSKVGFLKKLVEYGKRNGQWKQGLGMWAHPLEPVDYTSKKSDTKRLVYVASQHANYNLTMTCGEIEGIVDLHGEATIRDDNMRDVATITLGQAIRRYVKLNGESFIAELHQTNPMDPVSVVYANTPEAEHLFEMMAKHIGGFILNFFVARGATPDFAHQLLQHLEPEQRSSADECTWDDEKRILTTLADERADAEAGAFAQMSFFQDLLSEKLAADKASTKPGKKEKYAKAATMFKLDDEKSIKTVHAANEGKYPRSERGPDPSATTNKLAGTPPRKASTDDPLSVSSGSDDESYREDSILESSTSDEDEDEERSSSDDEFDDGEDEASRASLRSPVVGGRG